jgi:hypothetical protein
VKEYEARIFDEPVMWIQNTVRLAIRRAAGRYDEYLLPDGNWQSVEDGLLAPDPMGIVLPRASIEAVAVAVQEWQGHTSHADTEAKVLREWLAVERERVDKALVR